MFSIMADSFPTVGASGLRDHQAASGFDGDRRKLQASWQNLHSSRVRLPLSFRQFMVLLQIDRN